MPFQASIFLKNKIRADVNVQKTLQLYIKIKNILLKKIKKIKLRKERNKEQLGRQLLPFFVRW